MWYLNWNVKNMTRGETSMNWRNREIKYCLWKLRLWKQKNHYLKRTTAININSYVAKNTMRSVSADLQLVLGQEREQGHETQPSIFYFKNMFVFQSEKDNQVSTKELDGFHWHSFWGFDFYSFIECENDSKKNTEGISIRPKLALILPLVIKEHKIFPNNMDIDIFPRKI